MLPFLQDWFSGDPKISEQAAIFGVPDFWYMAERQPVPECLFFGGVRDVKKDVDGGKALAAFKAFWAKMEPVLHAERRTGSRAISKAEDPVDALRLQLRRHVGFVANNLGVVLQDLGRDQDAFELYELVLGTIDCDNICALFNEFEMARAGVPAAVARKAEIEKQLKAIVDDPKRRYMLWSLSRYYGYIRSPEIFARMGYAWARSGQTGNAIAQVQRAIDFVPADRQAGLPEHDGRHLRERQPGAEVARGLQQGAGGRRDEPRRSWASRASRSRRARSRRPRATSRRP